jgi:CheY-like chemotaxis protein
MPSSGASDLANNPIRVLLIEDNSDDRVLFARCFRAAAPEAVLKESDGVENALRQLDRMRKIPDIIFVDLHLIGTPSSEFIHWIRTRPEFAKVPIIAITGDVTRACAGPADYGVNALLMKPIAKTDLSALLVLARARRK